MSRTKAQRRAFYELPQVDLAPLVSRTLLFLKNSPRGASRVDILSAMNLQPQTWPALREALENSGSIVVVGRGPGLRHVHRLWAEDHPATNQVTLRANGPRLTAARVALRQVLQERESINSQVAQEVTGLRADPVRRLLLEMVNQGKVERTGKKRSTRYRWVGNY